MIPTLSRFLHAQEFLKRRRASSEHGMRDLVLSEVEGGAVNAACLLPRFSAESLNAILEQKPFLPLNTSEREMQ
jgi:hypothetical protein